MPKLIDHSPSNPAAIGNEGLLLFIDEVNDIRARAGNRYRFEPSVDRSSGVLKMREHLGIARPARANTPSPRYFRNAGIDR